MNRAYDLNSIKTERKVFKKDGNPVKPNRAYDLSNLCDIVDFDRNKEAEINNEIISYCID